MTGKGEKTRKLSLAKGGVEINKSVQQSAGSEFQRDLPKRCPGLAEFQIIFLAFLLALEQNMFDSSKWWITFRTAPQFWVYFQSTWILGLFTNSKWFPTQRCHKQLLPSQTWLFWDIFVWNNIAALLGESKAWEAFPALSQDYSWGFVPLRSQFGSLEHPKGGDFSSWFGISPKEQLPLLSWNVDKTTELLLPNPWEGG